jgi:hypothetical protein
MKMEERDGKASRFHLREDVRHDSVDLWRLSIFRDENGNGGSESARVLERRKEGGEGGRAGLTWDDTI